MTTPGPFVRVCSSAHVVTTRSAFFCLLSSQCIVHGFPWFLVVFFYGFQGSFMVFRGSWLVFMVFHGSFIVFMVLGWFSWFFRSIRNAGRSGVEGRPAPDTNSPSTACWVLLLTLWTLCDYSTHFVFFLECTPRIWYWLFCSHLPCVHCTVFCVNIFLTFNHTYVVETIFRVRQQKCVIQIPNEINFQIKVHTQHKDKSNHK